MSLTIRSDHRIRPVVRSDGSRADRPYLAVETESGYAVVDREGIVVAHASERTAIRFVSILNRLRPDARQLEVLVGDGEGSAFLRTITLRHPTTCSRCGGKLGEGSQARWHSLSRLVRHLRRCPQPAAAKRQRSTPTRKAA
jgi:hypothetical protein